MSENTFVRRDDVASQQIGNELADGDAKLKALEAFVVGNRELVELEGLLSLFAKSFRKPPSKLTVRGPSACSPNEVFWFSLEELEGILRTGRVDRAVLDARVQVSRGVGCRKPDKSSAENSSTRPTATRQPGD